MKCNDNKIDFYFKIFKKYRKRKSINYTKIKLKNECHTN